MAKITSESIDRVRDAADIVEIVSGHTDLRRQGERFVGLCPFHDERTPSFSVNPSEKLYYCFGCEAGGDVFGFLAEKEGLDFPDAVESLADRYGVEIERDSEDPAAEKERRRRARLGDLLDRTATFYTGYLWESPKAAKARDYLAGRGLGEETLKAFGIGYAPSAWDQVLTRGQRAGYSLEELVAAGLAQKGRKGGYYDRFRSRVMFPVRDPRGRVLGFGARALSADSKPKYLNSPEGALYRKGRTLFGIDRARGPIARSSRAIVVEGYTDVLALHGADLEETVAVMGTAITPEQLGLLAGHADEVVLALDADRAGREAMLRAQRVAAGRSVRLRVAAMPEGEDPADMVGEGAAGRFRLLVDEAQELPVFHVHAILADADLSSASGRDQALDEAVPVIAAMQETISRDELLREVADRLDADPGLVSRRVRSSKGGSARQVGEGAPAGAANGASAQPGSSASGRGAAEGGERRTPRSLGPRERRERALLAMCIAEPGKGRAYVERLTPEHLSTDASRRALAWLRGHIEAPLAGLPREDEQLTAAITQLVMSAEREPASAAAMELNFLELEQGLIENQLEAAHQEGGDPPVELQRQRAELAERIAHFGSVGA
jgi:DNA primase